MSKYKLHVATKGQAAFEQFVELPDNAEQREAFLSSLKRQMSKDKWLSLFSDGNHMTVRNDCVSHMILTKIVEVPSMPADVRAKIQDEIERAPPNAAPVAENIPFPEKPKE